MFNIKQNLAKKTDPTIETSHLMEIMYHILYFTRTSRNVKAIVER